MIPGLARKTDAQLIYEGYAGHAGWKSVHGEPLPSWDSQDPAIRAHWEAGFASYAATTMRAVSVGPAAVDLLEDAWGLLANVSNSDWGQQTEAWQQAAAWWRDNYHRLLRQLGTSEAGPTVGDMSLMSEACKTGQHEQCGQPRCGCPRHAQPGTSPCWGTQPEAVRGRG